MVFIAQVQLEKVQCQAAGFIWGDYTSREHSPGGYKNFFMLNSAEHEIYPAHKCQNANNRKSSNSYMKE